MTTNEESAKLGLTIDEARKMLGIGRNLMLQLFKVKGFLTVRFKRKNEILADDYTLSSNIAKEQIKMLLNIKSDTF